MPPDAPPPSPVADPSAADFSEHDLFTFLLENIPDRIYFKDARSRFLRVSRALAQLFRAESPEEVVGRTDFDYFTREHAEPAFEDELQVMHTGASIVGKVEKETLPDGRARWAITTKMPLRDRRGRIIGTCGISKDFTAQKALEDALAESNEKLASRQEQLQRTVTELHQAHENLKQMQQQLIEAEKMQTAGRLAYGVAHEIRNPLNILHAGLDFFAGEKAIAADATASAILGEMRNAVQRADAVVCTLLESSSEGRLELAPLDVPEVIRAALQALEPQLQSAGIAVQAHFAFGLPPLQLDREKMQQVFEGVFLNAIQAMSACGELRIRTGPRTLHASELEHDPGLRSACRFLPGETVAEIVIDDTGPGVPDDALGKVFDPFFTTKATGAGAGMGLTVCRKIVQLHGGAMHLTNRPEGGARATILLKLPAPA